MTEFSTLLNRPQTEAATQTARETTTPTAVRDRLGDSALEIASALASERGGRPTRDGSQMVAVGLDSREKGLLIISVTGTNSRHTTFYVNKLHGDVVGLDPCRHASFPVNLNNTLLNIAPRKQDGRDSPLAQIQPNNPGNLPIAWTDFSFDPTIGRKPKP